MFAFEDFLTIYLFQMQILYKYILPLFYKVNHQLPMSSQAESNDISYHAALTTTVHKQQESFLRKLHILTPNQNFNHNMPAKLL